ncbi:MAG: alpha/beta hydrolase, partial [Methylophilaceae bacterium]
MLFPSYAAKAIPIDWQPKGKNSQQAMISGSCGKLHVAIWRTPKAKGTIMMFHGNAESLASIDDYAYAFHELGYDLMAWDYPGYGKSTDCWFSQDTLLTDAETAYQWLAAKEKPENIHLFGYSV